LKDRFTNGLIAGAVAGVVVNILSFIQYALGQTEYVYFHFSSLLIFGRLPLMTSEIVWLTFTNIVFTAIFGAIFAYLTLLIGSKFMYIKSVLYGAIVWYLWYLLTTKLAAPGVIEIITLKTSISTTINTAIFGLIIGIVYSYIQNKDEAKVNW